MLVGADDVFIDVGSERKSGIYEFDGKHGLLARRVELPRWLSDQVFAIPPSEDLLPFFINRRWDPPHDVIAESKGHIYLNPDGRFREATPMVGLDEEVFGRFQASPAIKDLVFVVYGTDYLEVERWGLPWQKFVGDSFLVETKAPFMAQRMVMLSSLRRVKK